MQNTGKGKRWLAEVSQSAEGPLQPLQIICSFITRPDHQARPRHKPFIIIGLFLFLKGKTKPTKFANRVTELDVRVEKFRNLKQHELKYDKGREFTRYVTLQSCAACKHTRTQINNHTSAILVHKRWMYCAGNEHFTVREGETSGSQTSYCQP